MNKTTRFTFKVMIKIKWKRYQVIIKKASAKEKQKTNIQNREEHA